jgi:putative endonuclease
MVFHRIYESVELGSASFDHQPPSKLVAPVVTSFYCTAPRMNGQTILPVEVVGLGNPEFAIWNLERLSGAHDFQILKCSISSARPAVSGACTTIAAVHFVYMVRCADGTFYTGYARDPHAREQLHNRGRGARYTSGRRPVSLVYWESFDSIGDALRRERQLKRVGRAAKEALLGSGNRVIG